MGKVKNYSQQTDFKIVILRAIATILVVIGHSVFLNIQGNVSGIGSDYTNFIIVDKTVNRFLGILQNVIYVFHMPLFMSISGYIYEMGRKAGKYNRLIPFMLNKCKRLLVPFFCVAWLYCIPLLLSTEYIHSTTVVDGLKNNVLYFVGYGVSHLWFVFGLFLIFFVVEICHILTSKSLIMTAIMSIILYVLYITKIWTLPSLFYLDSFQVYLFWFVFGSFIYHLFGFIEKVRKQQTKLLALLCGMMLLVIIIATGYNNPISNLIQIGAIICAFFTCAELFSDKSLKCFKILKWVDKYSFPIYLYGVPLNFVILDLVSKHSTRVVELSSIGTWFLFMLRVLLQIVIPVCIQKFIENIGILLKKFGGNFIED